MDVILNVIKVEELAFNMILNGKYGQDSAMGKDEDESIVINLSV